ncbi:hypothetical protein RW1_048_00140 [Rhodococcus wratislaviensis NBRC 100605]|uniref:Uncharacterized protein n=1 Tax=Rhodococcus wratislaviensis NBRC 100605 TaxID=1219028 RepID=X0PX56_RHOWR|nr:hypothetical protein RW1_048_00140 [Rhodococcus wratislaviensis NBRC 100605]
MLGRRDGLEAAAEERLGIERWHAQLRRHLGARGARSGEVESGRDHAAPAQVDVVALVQPDDVHDRGRRLPVGVHETRDRGQHCRGAGNRGGPAVHEVHLCVDDEQRGPAEIGSEERIRVLPPMGHAANLTLARTL